MVPNPGDYQTLAWRDNAQMLVRNDGGVELLSNICRHRQAIMFDGRGSVPNIVCPIHRWTYDLTGKLLGAPHFAEQPCARLHSTSLKRWNGLLFDGPRDVGADLAGMRAASSLDFSGYMLDRIETKECNYNWKTFIEVYLEDYHVEPFHPGLGRFVSCDDLDWQFGERYCLQTVGVNNALARPGTKSYQRWHKAVLDYYRGDIALFEREFVDAEQAAYMETAAEDDEIAERMDAGRRALYKAGRSEVGPYQSPMEDGMQHFHEFLRRELGPNL